MKRRILGIPVFMFLLFAFAGVAIAAWIGIARLESNILGSKGVSLEVSNDNATWGPTLTALINKPDMALGEIAGGNWYLKSSEPPTNMLMTIENLNYTEGAGQGAVAGEKIYNHMILYKFTANGVDLRGVLDDCDGVAGGSFRDVLCNDNPIPYYDQLKYEFQVQLMNEAGAIDELNGDGFTFDVSFQPAP